MYGNSFIVLFSIHWNIILNDEKAFGLIPSSSLWLIINQFIFSHINCFYPNTMIYKSREECFTWKNCHYHINNNFIGYVSKLSNIDNCFIVLVLFREGLKSHIFSMEFAITIRPPPPPPLTFMEKNHFWLIIFIIFAEK